MSFRMELYMLKENKRRNWIPDQYMLRSCSELSMQCLLLDQAKLGSTCKDCVGSSPKPPPSRIIKHGVKKYIFQHLAFLLVFTFARKICQLQRVLRHENNLSAHLSSSNNLIGNKCHSRWLELQVLSLSEGQAVCWPHCLEHGLTERTDPFCIPF